VEGGEEGGPINLVDLKGTASGGILMKPVITYVYKLN
jgi:hypothetical protein